MIRKCNFEKMLEIFSGNSYLYSVYHFSILQVLWGGFLLLPMQTFAYPPYEAIGGFASEFAWGQ
ncbi:MAG: hypothetical protein LC650_00880 [Actinobacteria bacterium]|nr:hypothetical protein [Actinomycetota bacterium]